MGKWAEKARANSADSAKSPATGTNDTNGTGWVVPMPVNPEVALRGWIRAIEGLDPCLPQTGFTIGRWQKLYDASAWFLESFGRQAAIDGWETGDLFGLHPQVVGGGGLIERLGDHRGLVLADGEARWRHMGEVPTRYLRGWQPDLTPFWEVAL